MKLYSDDVMLVTGYPAGDCDYWGFCVKPDGREISSLWFAHAALNYLSEINLLIVIKSDFFFPILPLDPLGQVLAPGMALFSQHYL